MIRPLPWAGFSVFGGMVCRKDLNDPPTAVGGIERGL